MSETIEQMRKRHGKEIDNLTKSCQHKEQDQCVPFVWRTGAISHCIITCKNCGLELHSTAYKQIYGKKKSDGKWEESKFVKADNWFKCPKHENCHWYQTTKENSHERNTNISTDND